MSSQSILLPKSSKRRKLAEAQRAAIKRRKAPGNRLDAHEYGTISDSLLRFRQRVSRINAKEARQLTHMSADRTDSFISCFSDGKRSTRALITH